MDKVKTKIIDFYKQRPGQCVGAVKVDNALSLDDSKARKGWPTHDILTDFVKEGILEKCEHGKGFKYKQAS